MVRVEAVNATDSRVVVAHYNVTVAITTTTLDDASSWVIGLPH